MTRMGEWAKSGDIVKADGVLCEVVTGPWSGGGRGEPYVRCLDLRFPEQGCRPVPISRVRVEKTAEARVAERLAAEDPA